MRVWIGSSGSVPAHLHVPLSSVVLTKAARAESARVVLELHVYSLVMSVVLARFPGQLLTHLTTIPGCGTGREENISEVHIFLLTL